MVQKKFQNSNYLCDDVTNYVTNLEKNKQKTVKIEVFLKLPLWQLVQRFF